jgi:hypothetical protein
MTFTSGDMFYLRSGDAVVSHAAHEKRRKPARAMRAGMLSRMISPVSSLGARLSRRPGRKALHTEFAAISSRTLDDIGVRRSPLSGVVGTIENEQNARLTGGSERKARAERRDTSIDRRGPSRARAGRRIEFRMERRNDPALGRGARRVIVRVG